MSTTTTTLRVLISGAGIGGPVAAYWLAKAGHDVTVIERAPALRKEGQTVDIRREGLTIIDWMGIRGLVDERTTKEAGICLLDDEGKIWAEFPQSGDQGFTSEVEIVRGELAMLFYEISKSNVKYVFDTTIQDFTEVDDGVNVTLKGRSGGEPEQKTFDVIIAAEGLYSRTRSKAFKEDITKPIHSLDLFSAAFSLPAIESDTLWANATVYFEGRMMLVRPDGFGRTRISLVWRDHDHAEESRAIAHPNTPTDQQKEFTRLRFQDLSSSPAIARMLHGLAASDDLYLAEIGQAKSESWSRGRVVLLGDTAYCPSPLTGMGTTSAIVGAYVLAAELVRNPADHSKAFAAYEQRLRPWISKIQQLAPVRKYFHPASRFGVRIFYWMFFGISFIVRKFGFLTKLALPSVHQDLPLPPTSIFD